MDNMFSDEGGGSPGSFEEVLSLIMHAVEDHGMTMEQAIDIVIDMVRPGQSEHSHDVRPVFTGALYALGYGVIASNFKALYLNTMPWGIAFSVGVEQDFEFYALAKDAQRAVIMSFVAVLQAGGLDATITDENQILLKSPDGESSMTMDGIVSQFRAQLDEELGPDSDEPDGRRWLK